jgi:hypothetical protein
MSKSKKIVAIELDQAEIAIRIVEAISEAERPEGKTARECLDDLSDESRRNLFQASKAVAEYFFERIVASGIEDAQFMGTDLDSDKMN